MSVALVLGGAGTVWDEIDEALSLGEFDGVVACNDAGAHWPGQLDAWVSLHPEKFPAWTARRSELGHAPAKQILTHTQARPSRVPALVTATVGFRFPGQPSSGSSGLFALKVALVDLGFDRAVLCGIPMTADPGHFFDAAAWRGAVSHRQGWSEAMPHIHDRARSMSGWTADILGKPDTDWLGQ